MADIIEKGDSPRLRSAKTRWKDMGDGTFAEVVALGAPGGAATPIAVYNVATNGETFPSDSATSYTYDEGGVNIATITKTTPDGKAYVQTWTRAGSQLGSKSGWVRKP